MSEEYINPLDPKKLSLAEMNILEQLYTLSTQVGDTVKEGVNIVTDLTQGRRQAIKARYDRVRLLKNSAEDVKDRLVEYIVRTSPTLLYKDIYAESARSLERIAQNMDALAYRVLMVAHRNTTHLDEGTKEKLASLMDIMVKGYDKLSDAVRMLSVNPRKTIELGREVSKIEEEADLLYREVSLKIYDTYSGDIPLLLLLKEVIDIIENTCDIIKETADGLKYLALHKY